MTKPLSHDLSREEPAADSEARQIAPPSVDRRLADAEMARVLGTEPFRVALDSSGGGIAHWRHDPLHDVVEPMTHHVIMAYNGAVQRMERRSGRFISTGTFRPGVVIMLRFALMVPYRARRFRRETVVLDAGVRLSHPVSGHAVSHAGKQCWGT